MIEPWQILLIAVVTVLTILLTVIGIQIVYLLKEARNIMQKTNRMLDNVHSATQTFSSSVDSLTSFGAGLKSAVNLVTLIKNKFSSQNEEY